MHHFVFIKLVTSSIRVNYFTISVSYPEWCLGNVAASVVDLHGVLAVARGHVAAEVGAIFVVFDLYVQHLVV